MEDTMTKNYGSSSGLQGSGMGSIGERTSDAVSGAVDSVKDMASQYTDSDPKAHPRQEHREGPVARAIEQQTAKLPSDTFLWAAFGSIALSLTLELMGEEKKANFVGHWAPTFLILGLYNKIVKLQGSDGV